MGWVGTIVSQFRQMLVSVTVLLELERVLRGFYEVPAPLVCAVFRALAGIEHVTIEDQDAVLMAVDWTEAGMDFADALHPARSLKAACFATFDQKLAKRAKRLASVPEVMLL